MSKDKQPEIRFPGFTEDWEERKLGEIVQITMGQSPNSENYTENPEDYILVQGNADMKNNRVVPRVWTTQVTKQAEKGDLILSVRAPVGDIGKTDYDVVLGRGVAAVKGNDFIFQQLRKMKETGYWNRFSTGSTFESINSNDIREALITIPDEEEQKKIGTFFKQLDDTIALQQHKLDLLKETKKGFLQKMFPKDGASVPEIRFPGFTDDWEERKLGEVVVFLNGRAFKQQELLDSGKYRVLRVGNFNTNYRWYYSNLELEEDKYANKGDLLYLWATSFGPEMWNEERVIYHYHIWKLKFLSKELDKQYLYTWLLTDKEKIKESTNGTTMVHVTKGGIEQRTFQFPPDINEQQKIGTFFKQLDDTITLHQRKLDLLKETKKGFLQKMFV
ncbi:restriction endonuclease subunit S [Enterococcus hirae]